MRTGMLRTFFYVVISCVCVLLVVFSGFIPCENRPAHIMVPKDPVKVVYDSQQKQYTYHRDMPLIFIGGVPRSGTTLMRVMLDAHPMVRCGEETRIIPRILGMRSQWYKSQKEAWRLEEAGLTPNVINDAIAAFILEVIAKHGEAAPRLCNKDPFMLKSAAYLAEMFPNSKYILMIRDGRATVHSIIMRQVTITGFDLKSYRQCLTRWNQAVQAMYEQCIEVGTARCLPVWYEQLVLHPEKNLKKILHFLDIPWNDTVLHHEEQVGKAGGVSLSKTERSSDQVIKPVNLDALTKWVGAIPEDVVKDMATIAPMLRVLKYDPTANPPKYGEPDLWVKENTVQLEKDKYYWEQKQKQLRATTWKPSTPNESKRLRKHKHFKYNPRSRP